MVGEVEGKKMINTVEDEERGMRVLIVDDDRNCAHRLQDPEKSSNTRG